MHEDSIQVGAALAHLETVSGEDKIAVYSSNNYEYDVIIVGGYLRNLGLVFFRYLIFLEEILQNWYIRYF